MLPSATTRLTDLDLLRPIACVQTPSNRESPARCEYDGFIVGILEAFHRVLARGSVPEHLQSIRPQRHKPPSTQGNAAVGVVAIVNWHIGIAIQKTRLHPHQVDMLAEDL